MKFVDATLNHSKRPAMTDRLKRLKFRAWHRGTREADYMIGGFFDRYSSAWGEAELAWYEAVVEEDDVDIMGWALGTDQPPASSSSSSICPTVAAPAKVKPNRKRTRLNSSH